MDYRNLKRRILYQLFYCNVFISIVLLVYAVYMREEAQNNEAALRLGLAIVPFILTHVPWSAARWGVKAKELRKNENHGYDILSALVDIAFAISIVVSFGFFFSLFDILFFFFAVSAVMIFFMIISIKILFFSFNS